MDAIWPLGSTATKLVRTLLMGLEVSLATLPAGDLPREGGGVLSEEFDSNRARREATPLGDRPCDMTSASRGVSNKYVEVSGANQHHSLRSKGRAR